MCQSIHQLYAISMDTHTHAEKKIKLVLCSPPEREFYSIFIGYNGLSICISYRHTISLRERRNKFQITQTIKIHFYILFCSFLFTLWSLCSSITYYYILLFTHIHRARNYLRMRSFTWAYHWRVKYWLQCNAW